MKSLYASLVSCKKEEEVKAEFCKFFKMKINALKAIDHYTSGTLFEFKYDLNFRNAANVAHVLAQTMYYARLLKYSLTKYPLSPFICVVDKNEAFFVETKDFARFYASTAQKYDWDRAASTPCPVLVADIAAFLGKHPVYVYDLTKEAEEAQFVELCNRRILAQATFDALLDRKSITEENFIDVFEYWDSLFGKYVQNGRKSSEYFLADIENGKARFSPSGEVLFNIEDDMWIRKNVSPKTYEHFWQNYERIDARGVMQIRQKYDRLTEDCRRRFTGEFYTPVEFATKGLDYLERELGRAWWKSGEYRLWDMAAGTGNLEFELPSAALPYCYISTLEETEAQYCQKIFPSATCFQYNYLEDDIATLAGNLDFGSPRKMPAKLVEDLKNPKLKWIVFINPPFATANSAGAETGKESKGGVSMTPLRAWMMREGYGEASRELFVQFLFRISKEFAGKPAHLCLFSKLKYLNSNNDQKIRDGFFQYAYCRGFIFPIKCFHGSKGNFPVGFLVWNLTQKIHLSKQAITLDVFNAELEKVGTKTVPCVNRTEMLNKWCPRPKWDGHSVMPMFTSALNQQMENKDQRDHIAEGYLFSVVSKGDDFQNTNACFILSTPYANAGAFSVTAENFVRAMILHAVKKIPVATWTNDRDAFYAPKSALGEEFIADCVVWSTFAPSNYTVSLKDVSYKGTTYQIRNNLYPFPFGEVRAWGCPLSDIAAQFAGRDEDRYLARWLKGRTLSSEARAVLDAAQLLYRCFYSEILNTNWVDYRVRTWDLGLYQIVQSVKGTNVAVAELSVLKTAHEALREKLLPQILDLGFINRDVDYFV